MGPARVEWSHRSLRVPGFARCCMEANRPDLCLLPAWCQHASADRAMKRVSLPALGLCALVGVLVGIGGYTVHYAGALSYLSDDPKACVNCHIMREQYDGWQKASHHAVATCND